MELIIYHTVITCPRIISLTEETEIKLDFFSTTSDSNTNEFDISLSNYRGIFDLTGHIDRHRNTTLFVENI